MISDAFRCAKIVICSVALTALALVPSMTAQNAATDKVPTITFQPERSTMSGAIVYRSATMLVRTRDAVTGTIHTSGLIPNNVYTGWFGIFNHPEHCSTRPCNPPVDLANPLVQGSLVNMGGVLVGPDGTADFGEVRAVGDTTNAFSGPGLLNPRGAEIHLAVRHHGAALMEPGFTLQLTTFNGGCTAPYMNTCTTIQAAPHAP
jgi:hypothetical protein